MYIFTPVLILPLRFVLFEILFLKVDDFALNTGLYRWSLRMQRNDMDFSPFFECSCAIFNKVFAPFGLVVDHPFLTRGVGPKTLSRYNLPLFVGLCSISVLFQLLGFVTFLHWSS